MRCSGGLFARQAGQRPPPAALTRSVHEVCRRCAHHAPSGGFSAHTGPLVCDRRSLAFRNANNSPLIVGESLLLTERHAKVRREGYRR
jgi:hypothetical protein